MVGVLVRLRLTLLRHHARGGVEKVLLLVASLLMALGAGVLATASLVALRLVDLDLAGAGVVVVGTVVVVAWAVVPVLASTDEVMNDPARFALLPLPGRRLAVGLLVASSVGPFPVVTLVSSLALAVTFSRGPLPAVSVLVALLGGVLGTLTCLLGSRAVLTSAASLLARRRGREFAIGVGVLVASLLGLVGPALALLGDRLQTGAVDAAVRVLAWSPFAAAWAMPWAAAEGRWAAVAGRALVAGATLALLWWLYERAVRSRLRPSGSGGSRARTPQRGRPAGTGRRPLLPDTPLGALTHRSLRYWVRDSRYVVSVIALPVVTAVLLVVPTLSGSPPGLALVTGPLVGLLLSLTMLNELALDGSAVWTSLAAGVRGRDDRAARTLGLLLWAAPLTVVVAVAGAEVGGRPELAPALTGLAVGALLVGNAVATVSSVALPFPVPPAGSNPFAGNPGSGTAALVQQGLSILVLLPLLAPLLGTAVWAWFSPGVGWVLAFAGPAYGTALLAVGVHVGGDLYDRRGPELLARLSR